ncbi:MAG: Flp pilus assembly complex ATPase component TadA [Methylophilaceae bacterium]|nr:Flp pilus assembly complex ATPase component TadA [Methylophilaceae bacterium]
MHTIAEWPAPPYFDFARDKEVVSPEICLIYCSNGDKKQGELIHFSAGEPSIRFKSTLSSEIEVIPLDQIKIIRLARAISIKKQFSILEARAQEVFPASTKQPYTIEFNDKEIIKGDTVGHCNQSNGLYLYVPVEEEKVLCCFFPKKIIASQQIGLKIGELLMQENLVSQDEVVAAVSRQQDLRQQRIGDYLSENEVLTREELEQAIRHQEGQPILRLGEALQQLELITAEQLTIALAKQKDNRTVPLGRILVEMGALDERALKGALAKKLGVPYVSLTKFNFDLNVFRLIEAAVAKKHVLVPLCMHEKALVVAFEDPLNIKVLDELRFATQLKIVPAMASREDIKMAISKHYSGNGIKVDQSGIDLPAERMLEFDISQSKNTGDLASQLFTEDTVSEESAFEAVAESDNTLVQLVNTMILEAYNDGVSDIHIETYAGKANTRVRFRKDGTLVDYLEIPANFRNAVISRIKIMSQLDISERRKPQDGKIDFAQYGPAKVELRVATIPTTTGLEDIVMRVLAAAKPVPMSKLGLSPHILKTLQKAMERPYGLILVCGPTGSGKTTTLHSLLGHINTPDRKIWTAEDPVEITQPGLRQVQVNSKIGWTFANAIRSFLRADPDVIMVGEMRDQETAKTGVEASLTGHLVLSTLHTNTAPESVIRLLDLGMDPFNFADALLSVLAQRLAKTLCVQCKQTYTPDEQEINALLTEYADGIALDTTKTMVKWEVDYAKEGKFSLCKSVGCPACAQTGYKGRLGIHELMSISPEVKRLIQIRAPVSEMIPAAFENGMLTLKQDGINKVLQGLTDISQIRAVCS